MIVLDTNVISALMRTAPDPAALTWLDAQPTESVWTTSVCVFEIQCGLGMLPAGKRRQALERAFEHVLQDDLGGRVLVFDLPAARHAASITSRLRAAGQVIEIRDAQIAGTVSASRGTLATRNTKHFAETGIMLVNPWEIPPS